MVAKYVKRFSKDIDQIAKMIPDRTFWK
jgi:hypothetical protein